MAKIYGCNEMKLLCITPGMANQRNRDKRFVSAWINKDLKRDAKKLMESHGFSGTTDFIEVSFRCFIEKPFRRPRD